MKRHRDQERKKHCHLLFCSSDSADKQGLARRKPAARSSVLISSVGPGAQVLSQARYQGAREEVKQPGYGMPSLHAVV